MASSADLRLQPDEADRLCRLEGLAKKCWPCRPGLVVAVEDGIALSADAPIAYVDDVAERLFWVEHEHAVAMLEAALEAGAKVAGDG